MKFDTSLETFWNLIAFLLYICIANINVPRLKPFSSNHKGSCIGGKMWEGCLMHGFTFSRDLRLISHCFASQTKALATHERKAHPVLRYLSLATGTLNEKAWQRTAAYSTDPDVLFTREWLMFCWKAISLSFSLSLAFSGMPFLNKKVSAFLLLLSRARAKTQR